MRRKSIYVTGSQQQQDEGDIFEDEQIETFGPNIESTRVIQNSTTSTVNTPEASMNGGSKYYNYIGPA